MRRAPLRIGAFGLAGVVVFALLGGAGVAGAASGPCGSTGVYSGSDPFTCTYSTVGSDTFTVPAGVTSASLNVVGAVGGNYFVDGDAAHPDPLGAIVGRGGGGGGGASGTLALSVGSVLQVDVAGAGGQGNPASRSGGMKNGPSGGVGGAGGFGGSNNGVPGGPGDASGASGGTAFNGGDGGGGGGSSDVRVDPAGCAGLMCPLTDAMLVGAGGGGAGGTGGQGNAIGGAGGSGGGASGAAGGALVDGGNAGVPGGAGTPSAGGAGGLEPGLHAAGANPSDPRYGGDGATGATGSGGAGGHGNLPCQGTWTPACTTQDTTSGGGAGGGAGGGFFGGGGGSGGGGLFGGYGGAGGGGGGGSSFTAPGVTNAVLTANANANTSFLSGPSTGPETYTTSGSVNSGNGQVTITWTAPQTTPTCVVTAIRRNGPAGHDEEDVRVTDPSGVASLDNVVITNGQVFVGGDTGTRIDPGGTTLSTVPTSVVVTAVKTNQTMLTRWSFDTVNAEGNTTHCA